ncbi:Uncharacterized membrane protein [Paucidesulfovibrio gracilis DSM 16080]|uniref:Uncharacterized membrane protein n=1 Tax=Paucidesulfovibrio gracilis DSM 16080 TaxID=1121449 RepID=A0A1T4WJ48_9BACT|nr:PACE efflux transporter [Paucidesulfovibrio gracilis]SKA76928.1 Uncharacterized membrane protein [Paucidesulfovibrio gracilis DSM 16080]
MRTRIDRLRHAVLFEVLGIAISAPASAWILDRPVGHMGYLSIALATTAMIVNYVYNLAFDHALKQLGRPVHLRPTWMRVLHAFCFEGTLLVVAVPMVAWWLNMTVWQAFITDIGFAVFYLVYGFVYNWGYDVVFPMPSAEVSH